MARRVVYGNDTSENGWPIVDQDSCEWITVPGTDVRLQIQKGQPLALLRAFAADFNAFVEPLRDRDSACWTATNSVPTSNHLGGTACDLNWDSHPFRILNAGFTSEQINTVRDLLAFYENTIWWGNDWNEPKDAMHFQVGYDTYENPHTADVIARKIRADGYSTFRRGEAPSVDLAQLLSDAMGGSLSLDRYRELQPAVSAALLACDCTSVERVAMWCAQIGHESGGLQWMEEIADGSAYEGRTDLGNTEPGDGRRFKGRGPIQVTGRDNYRKLSAWAFSKQLVPTATFFVDNPDELASDAYGFVGVVWYWTVARSYINELCDNNDIDGVTRAINGGLHGIDDRRARWQHCLNISNLLALVAQHDSTTGDGFLMALTDAEQRELLDLARQQSAYRRVSRSPLRHVGEGPTETATGFDLNVDGNVHVLLVYLLAKLGDPDSLNLLHEVANLDPTRYADRAHDKQLAQAILNELANTTTPGSAPATGQVPGTAQAPIVVANSVEYQTVTSGPQAGGVKSSIAAVDAGLQALRNAVEGIAQQVRS